MVGEPISIVSNCLRKELKGKIEAVRATRERLVCVDGEVLALTAALSENAEKERLRITAVFQEVGCLFSSMFYIL